MKTRSSFLLENTDNTRPNQQEEVEVKGESSTQATSHESKNNIFSVIREKKAALKGSTSKKPNEDEVSLVMKKDETGGGNDKAESFISFEKQSQMKSEVDNISIGNCKSSSKFQPKFKLDINKYKNFNSSNTLKKNNLLQTAHALKKNFPFKDHLRQKHNSINGLDDNSLVDVFGLDKVTFTDNTKNKSTEIQTDMSKVGTYFEISNNGIKSVDNKEQFVNKLMKKSVLPDDLERMEKCPKFYENRYQKSREKKKKVEETAGPNWYHLPKTEITDELKRDLQVIKMRNALDGKHHYKRNDTNKFPKYFQMGTVVEGPHEFYSSRVSKKNRKRTMVDELLANAEFRKKNKKKLIEMEKKKTAGGKQHYKQKKNKRKSTFART